MLTENIHPITYELDIYALISGVVLDCHICKETSKLKFKRNLYILNIFYIFVFFFLIYICCLYIFKHIYIFLYINSRALSTLFQYIHIIYCIWIVPLKSIKILNLNYIILY